jgi:hypothetical protein
MKKLLFITFSLFSLTYSYSQCVPDPIYADSLWGIWPNTTQNFTGGNSGTYYQQVINFKIPTDAGDLDPSYSGIPLDYISLYSVDGIPPGITFSCDTSNCTWPGGAQGCATISGTPTTNGTYPINLKVVGCVTISFGLNSVPVCDTVEFSDYIIQIGPVGINDSKQLASSSLKLNDAIPNPSDQISYISYNSLSSENISFQITNLLGATLLQENFISNIGLNSISVNTSIFPNGVYLYSISNGLFRSTKRLIVHH